MSARNTKKNKALRRQERDENRRKQEKKRIAARVRDASIRGMINGLYLDEE